MSRFFALAGLTALMASAVQAAPTHAFDYTYNGSGYTTHLSAAGQQLLNGESVGLTLRAAGNDYFQVVSSWGLWAPVGMVECGSRVGDLTFSVLLNGATVASGGYAGQGSSCIHIAQNLAIAVGIQFDELRWEFTQTSTSTSPNTLTELFAIAYGSGSEPMMGTASYVRQPHDVPEPAALLLAGAGLVGAALARRRAKA